MGSIMRQLSFGTFCQKKRKKNSSTMETTASTAPRQIVCLFKPTLRHTTGNDDVGDWLFWHYHWRQTNRKGTEFHIWGGGVWPVITAMTVTSIFIKFHWNTYKDVPITQTNSIDVTQKYARMYVWVYERST